MTRPGEFLASEFLLDTCMVSEIRRSVYPQRVQAALKDVEHIPANISVITVGELVKGINLLPISRKRGELEDWLLGVQEEFLDRTLAVTEEVALTWGGLAASAQRRGKNLSVADGLIAATALVHDLTLVTRNSADFDGTGVRVFDPWRAG